MADAFILGAGFPTEVGYLQLPTTDELGSLLDDAARQRGGIRATVVDLAPNSVVTRLTSLGYDVSETFEDIGEFVQAYVGGRTP